MSKLNEVFERIQKTKRELKDLKTMYSDALRNSQQYQNLKEDLKGMKEKKMKIENQIKTDFASELNKMDNLKADIENDAQLMSDIAVSKLANGQNIEITDQDQNQYEPVFKVTFKKSK